MPATFKMVCRHPSSDAFSTRTLLSPASFIRLINPMIQSPCICAHFKPQRVSQNTHTHTKRTMKASEYTRNSTKRGSTTEAVSATGLGETPELDHGLGIENPSGDANVTFNGFAPDTLEIVFGGLLTVGPLQKAVGA